LPEQKRGGPPPKIAINLVFQFQVIVGMTCINTIETLQSALYNKCKFSKFSIIINVLALSWLYLELLF
jgi:hypothetical protein